MTRRELLWAGAGLLLPLPPSKARLERFKGQAVLDRIAARAKAEDWAKLTIGDRMGRVGLELVGTPYVAFTLETEDPVEYLTVDLEGLDCVTFFESTLDMARVIPAGLTRERLLAEVRRTRYRGGKQTDYASRLHYTMDWIYDNSKKGVVNDITAALPGAEPFTQRVGFMSSHPNSYKQLKANPRLVPAIAKMEDAVNIRPKWYIPTASVPQSNHYYGPETSSDFARLKKVSTLLIRALRIDRPKVFFTFSTRPMRLGATM